MLDKKELDHFNAERERLNDIVFEYAGLPLKRFFSLDGQTYRDDGVLPVKQKELIALVASLVLRCDDCVKYHVMQCRKAGLSDEEFAEGSGIAVIVGGSIVIPHLRRAMEVWDLLKRENDEK